MNAGPVGSTRLALQRFFARTDFVISKTSISRSGPGPAAGSKGSRPDGLVFMSSTLSTSQAAKPVYCRLVDVSSAIRKLARSAVSRNCPSGFGHLFAH